MDDRVFDRIVNAMESVPLIPEDQINRAVQAGVRVGGRWPRPVSKRERQMLQALSFGLTPDMAAKAYGISEGTVKKELLSARFKLGGKNNTHAVAWAIRTGLIQ